MTRKLRKTSGLFKETLFTVFMWNREFNYHPTSIRDQSRLHQSGKKVSPGIFLGYALIAGGIWEGDILIADLEDMEKLDASEIYPRRINAKEVLMSEKGDEFIFPVADGTSNLSGRLRIPRTH